MDPKEPVSDATSGLWEAEHERLATRLREAREYLGLSQEFVAQQLGLPRATISAMETARRKVTSLELKQLARLYRRDYSFFLGDEPAPDDEPVNAALFRTTQRLSRSDREQVLRFAQFLRHAGGGPQASRDRAREVPGEADDS